MTLNLVEPAATPDAGASVNSEKRVKDLWEMFTVQREIADVAETWAAGTDENVSHIKIPRASTPDAKALREKAPTSYLGLTETVVAQMLFVEGYREEDSKQNSKAWDAYQQNGMDKRQSPLHRAAIRHGQSFMLTVPGRSRLLKSEMASMRGYSALQMVASYDDPANDEWPDDAMYVEDHYSAPETVDYQRLFVVDDHQIVEWKRDGSGKFEFIGVKMDHDLEICPVIRFTNMLDLQGNATGEIIPFIPLASRIDQDTFDRLIVQRYGAWRVRWASGLLRPDDAAAQDRASLEMRMGDLLINPAAEGRFGTLDPTELAGYIAAREADIRDLAAVTQIPPQYLLGSVTNMSAEALAACEAMLSRKVTERKHSFGESHEQNLRLAAHIAGDKAGAADFKSSVHWADVETRSLAQVADALGKLATMLELPWEALVDRIPGWTDQDTKAVKALKEEQAAKAMDDAIALADATTPPPTPAAAPAKPAAPTPALLASKRAAG